MQTRVEGTSADIQSLLALCELQRQLSNALSSSQARPDQVESIRRRLGAALTSLPSGFAERYEALLRHAHPPAIPIKRASHCPACHIRFPAQLEFKVLNRSVLFACPRCSRLLYHLEPSADRKDSARVRSRKQSTVRAARRV